MATPSEIAQIRNEVLETENTEPYTDDFIGEMFDAYGYAETVRRIWIAKRNSVAELVDISEGGSSRKNSQLFDQFSKIVASYDAANGGGTESPGYRAPRTREITRS